jgi:hypothetical protein
MHTHFRNYGLKYEPDIVILAAMNKLSILKESSGAEKILAHTNRIFSAFARRNLGDWPALGVAPFIYSLF